MPTVGDLQIKIGADVTSALNGLSKAEFAANKVASAFEIASEATKVGGFVIAGWAQNFTTAISAVNRDLQKIDLSKLDEDGRASTSNMIALASGAQRVTESISVAGSAFSGMQAIAGPALAGIARLIPSIGATLAGLAGPIGIAVGALAAGAALIVSNWDLVNNKLTDTEAIIVQANKAIVQEKLETEKLVNVLKSDITSRQDKINALKKLNETSTTYFGNLNTEKSTVEDITKAYDGYIANILNAAKAQAAQDKIIALTKEQLDIQLRYNSAILDAGKANKAVEDARGKTLNPLQGAEATKLDLTLGKAQNLKKQLDENQSKIDEISNFAANLSVNIDRGGTISSAGKAAETEGDKIKNILSELDRNLSIIEKKFTEGIIPNEKNKYDAIVDAMQSAIDSGLKIDPNNKEINDVIQRYKAFAGKENINIALVPTLQAASVGSLGDLPDRVSDVADQMNASFSKINFAQSFEEKARAAKDAIQKQLEGISNTISTVASQVSSALSVINTIESNGIAAREQELDAYYEKQKELIESSISDESIKNKKYEQLEKDVAAKRKAIKKDEAAANKRSSIFNAIINTAQGVSAALATGNIPLAAIVGALGAAQVAAITATPLPALAKGGVATGRNTVIVGEYPGADNNPELILPADKAKKYIVEAVASTGGGGGVQQLYSYVSGDDLALISERGAYRKSRVG